MKKIMFVVAVVLITIFVNSSVFAQVPPGTFSNADFSKMSCNKPETRTMLMNLTNKLIMENRIETRKQYTIVDLLDGTSKSTQRQGACVYTSKWNNGEILIITITINSNSMGNDLIVGLKMGD